MKTYHPTTIMLLSLLFSGLILAGCQGYAQIAPTKSATPFPTLTGTVMASPTLAPATSLPIPTATQTYEEEFLQEITDFQEQYGIDFAKWSEQHSKTVKERTRLLESVAESEWTAIVVDYVDHIAWMKRLIQFKDQCNDYRNDTCLSPKNYIVLDLNAKHCEPVTGNFEGNHIKPFSIYFDSRNTEEESCNLINGEIGRVSPILSEKEDLVEVIIEEQINRRYLDRIGEESQTGIELQAPSIYRIRVFRNIDNKQLGSIFIESKNLNRESQPQLDRIFANFPEYSYFVEPTGGLSTTPVLINTRGIHDLSSIIMTASHELAHKLMEDYAIGRAYFDEDSTSVWETTTNILGIELTLAYFDYYNLPLPTHLGFENPVGLLYNSDGTKKTPEQILDINKAGEFEGLYENPRVIELWSCTDTLDEFWDFIKDTQTTEEVQEALDLCYTH